MAVMRASDAATLSCGHHERHCAAGTTMSRADDLVPVSPDPPIGRRP